MYWLQVVPALLITAMGIGVFVASIFGYRELALGLWLGLLSSGICMWCENTYRRKEMRKMFIARMPEKEEGE